MRNKNHSASVRHEAQSLKARSIVYLHVEPTLAEKLFWNKLFFGPDQGKSVR
jgi:hypothetical protein